MNKYRLQIRFIDYACLIDAIPTVQKDLLKEQPVSKYKLDVENVPAFEVDSKYIKIMDAKCKELYWYFIRTKFIKPTCEAKWNVKNNYNFTGEVWKHIHLLKYKACRDTILQSFQLNIIHRLFPCNEKLFNRSINENSLCSVCDANCIDNTTHYFVLCDNVKTFWMEVFNWWYNLSGTIFNVEIYGILF